MRKLSVRRLLCLMLRLGAPNRLRGAMPRMSIFPSQLPARLAKRTAPAKVQVFIDLTMFAGLESALDFAITSWNDQLTSTGVQFEKTTSACGSGPACITIEEDASLVSCVFSSYHYVLPSTTFDAD